MPEPQPSSGSPRAEQNQLDGHITMPGCRARRSRPTSQRRACYRHAQWQAVPCLALQSHLSLRPAPACLANAFAAVHGLERLPSGACSSPVSTHLPAEPAAAAQHICAAAPQTWSSLFDTGGCPAVPPAHQREPAIGETMTLNDRTGTAGCCAECVARCLAGLPETCRAHSCETKAAGCCTEAKGAFLQGCMQTHGAHCCKAATAECHAD